MKVILLKDVRRLGTHGEVKEVNEGFAANFLFPQKLAEPATEEKLKQAQARKQAQEEAVRKEEEALNNKLNMLRGKKVSLYARATEKGGLFKSIGPKDVAKAILAEHSLQIPEDAIEFPEPIKTTGEHAIQLSSKSTSSEMTVAVIADAK